MSTATTTAAPEPQDGGNHAERLLRAQAAELSALRARIADLPDVDVLASWRASHERLSQLQADLPGWRQQLEQAHQAEQDRLRQTVEQQQQALADAQLRSELQAAFTQSGGSILHFDGWRELAGKNITRAEDGSLLINGKPASEALRDHRDDAVYGVFFHPRMGSGGGARSGFDSRVVNTINPQKMSKGELFRAGFVDRKGNNQ